MNVYSGWLDLHLLSYLPDLLSHSNLCQRERERESFAKHYSDTKVLLTRDLSFRH